MFVEVKLYNFYFFLILEYYHNYSVLILILILMLGSLFAKKNDSYENTSKYFDNHLSVGIGIVTIKVFNVVQISYDK